MEILIYISDSESDPFSLGKRLLMRSCFPTCGAPISMQLIFRSRLFDGESRSVSIAESSVAFNATADGLFLSKGVRGS